ncbi:MAG: hypothetical protein IJC89_04045 [Clostridia bacterium]|nr:hypothetical protein [Clostridia bacterium]
MSYMILDYRTNKKIIKKAKKYGFEVVLTQEIPGIDASVAGHPDMQLTKVGNSLIVSPECYDYYREMLPDVEIYSGKKKVQGKYPEYVAYNVALTSSYMIHNFEFTDPVVLEHAGENVKKIDVSQGYSKCSCLTLPGSVITSDKGIAKKCQEKGLSFLLIEEGDITLTGKDFGFIGGASGYYKNIVYFAGNIKKHKSGEKILRFLHQKCIETVCLSNDKLADIGSIIIV